MELDQRDREAVLAGARMALSQWSERVGAAGTGAMRAIPGLSAQVDQHLVRIRHALGDPPGRIHPVVLAAYADGVADAAAGRGWSPAETAAAGWVRASWPSVHLLAVCVLAAEL